MSSCELITQPDTDVSAKMIMTTVVTLSGLFCYLFIIVVVESNMTETCPSKHTEQSMNISYLGL